MSDTEQTVFLITNKPIISLKHTQLQPHKLNLDIFGNLNSIEYQDLKNDIEIRGIQDPLHVVKQNGVYIVVSGHQRLKAAQELNIDLPCIVRTDLTEDWQIEEQLIKDNLLRRHLNDYQKVNAGERLEAIERIKAKDKLIKSANLKERTETGQFKNSPEVPFVAPVVKVVTVEPKTRDIVAKQVGMSHTQYDNAKKVKYEAPEPIKKKWQAGEISTGTAIAAIKKEQKQEQLKEKKEQFKQQSKESIKENKPTIYYKDSIEWLTSLEDNYADLLITDPPYMTDVENIIVFSEWVLLALKKVKPNGKAYICTGPYPQELNAYLNVLSSQDKFEISNILVWTYRNTLGPSPKTGYKNNWQAIFYLVGKNTSDLNCPIMIEQFSVQDINAPDGRLGNRFHAWQKPDELADRFIRHSTKEQDIVIDPFNGTGTFLISAAKLNRKAFGCDNNLDMLKISEMRGCNVIKA